MIPDEMRTALHELASRISVYRAALIEAGFSVNESLLLAAEYQKTLLIAAPQKGPGQ